MEQVGRAYQLCAGLTSHDSTYQDIASKIECTGAKNAVFYLATAPRFFSEVAQRLGSSGLLQETDDGFRRVIIEKPFGSDLASAVALNGCLLKVMSKNRSTESTITWARTRSRTSLPCGSPTACSRPSGTRTIFPTWKSRLPRKSVLKAAGAISIRPASCAT
ncbi:hypothetical protein F2S75_07410 [Pseudomonas syringae pv. actinidiae]|nr:hypothetical protein [Pseudomonas syringae pv. actinidiae]